MVWDAAVKATEVVGQAMLAVALLFAVVGGVIGSSVLLSRWLKTMPTWLACVVCLTVIFGGFWVMIFCTTLAFGSR